MFFRRFYSRLRFTWFDRYRLIYFFLIQICSRITKWYELLFGSNTCNKARQKFLFSSLKSYSRDAVWPLNWMAFKSQNYNLDIERFNISVLLFDRIALCFSIKNCFDFSRLLSALNLTDFIANWLLLSICLAKHDKSD